jgi:hypothetical protein
MGQMTCHPPGKHSGLGLGDGAVTWAALVLIVLAVTYLAITHADSPGRVTGETNTGRFATAPTEL